MRNTERILLIFTAFLMIACSPYANIEALVPSVGKVGDVIDIRDSRDASLSEEGTVYFAGVAAPLVHLWTSEDVFVEVPPGITGTASVFISTGGYITNTLSFSLREDVHLKRIVCFGDSIFHWGVPPILQNFIDQDEDLNTLDLIVLDHAKDAERLTGDGTWTRWQNAMNLSDPDLVILLEGTNDVSDYANLLMEDIQQSLTNMLDEALRTGLDPVLCTLLPRVGSCGDSESPTTEEFNDWLKSYADGIGIPVVDLYEGFVSTPDWQNVYYGTDCIHPSQNGRQRIAHLLTAQIREAYLPPCTDLDEDGYGDPPSPMCAYDGTDCDDSDPNVHPDATEDCLNGIDDDCDSLVDFDDSDCSCWDTDGDLYEDQACGGTDCDDSDPNVNPGLSEAPFGDSMCTDGIDNDCDGDIDTLDLGCME